MSATKKNKARSTAKRESTSEVSSRAIDGESAPMVVVAEAKISRIAQKITERSSRKFLKK